MRVHTLIRDQELPGRPEEVFDLFADARNLEAITPPLLNFEVITPGDIEMRAGTLITYRLRLHGVPVSWLTSIPLSSVCWRPNVSAWPTRSVWFVNSVLVVWFWKSFVLFTYRLPSGRMNSAAPDSGTPPVACPYRFVALTWTPRTRTNRSISE